MINNYPYCLAIIGGIASGKSSVSKILQNLGVTIIDADKIAKNLMNIGTFAYHETIKHFGSTYLLEDLSLDRKSLRKALINFPDEKLWLENLLHPLVQKEIKSLLLSLDIPLYCAIEISAMKNKDNYPYIKKTIQITIPKALQVQRLLQRDKCSLQDAYKLIELQNNALIADNIIVNDSSFSNLEKQVLQIHEIILSNLKSQK